MPLPRETIRAAQRGLLVGSPPLSQQVPVVEAFSGPTPRLNSLSMNSHSPYNYHCCTQIALHYFACLLIYVRLGLCSVFKG